GRAGSRRLGALRPSTKKGRVRWARPFFNSGLDLVRRFGVFQLDQGQLARSAGRVRPRDGLAFLQADQARADVGQDGDATGVDVGFLGQDQLDATGIGAVVVRIVQPAVQGD